MAALSTRPVRVRVTEKVVAHLLPACCAFFGCSMWYPQLAFLIVQALAVESRMHSYPGCLALRLPDHNHGAYQEIQFQKPLSPPASLLTGKLFLIVRKAFRLCPLRWSIPRCTPFRQAKALLTQTLRPVTIQGSVKLPVRLLRLGQQQLGSKPVSMWGG